MVTRGTRTLSEAASKQLLVTAGIPIAPELRRASPAQAVFAANELGYPVVVKLCGDGIAHKSERGLVRLDLADAHAVRAASEELLAAARPDDGPVELLVARMVRGTRELIAGVVHDPHFGACVMVGVGGVLAELIGDVVFRLAPITEVDARDMLDDLAHPAILGPFRGEPPVDREALVGILLALSALVTRDPDIHSIDVNPLVIADGRPVAVDALVELRA